MIFPVFDSNGHRHALYQAIAQVCVPVRIPASLPEARTGRPASCLHRFQNRPRRRNAATGRCPESAEPDRCSIPSASAAANAPCHRVGFSRANPPKTVQLCPAHLMDCPITELASVLVHEVVHLRIDAMGVGYRDTLRERVEQCCIRAQASFLRRCGADGAVLAEAYESALSTPWWTDDSHRSDMEISLSRAGMPRWMVRSYVGLFLKRRSSRE